MRKNIIILKLITTLPMLSGCSAEDTNSTDVSTGSIWARIKVESETTGSTRVSVELNEEWRLGPNINLIGNDRLEVSSGGLASELKKDIDLFDIDYNTRLATSSSEDPFRIAFYRNNGAINNQSVVSLPDGFTMTSPAEEQIFTDIDNVLVTWTPARSGAEIKLAVNTHCRLLNGTKPHSIESYFIADTGSAVIDLNEINSLDRPDLNKSGNCELSIALERKQTGVVDPVFSIRSEIFATQNRSVGKMSIVFTN